MLIAALARRCLRSLWRRRSNWNFNWDERRQIKPWGNYRTGCGKWWECDVSESDDLSFNEVVLVIAKQVSSVSSQTASTTENYLLRNVNRDYDRLGKIYVAEYYSRFDNPAKRLSLVALYHHEDSFMTFEGENYRGTKKILEKFEKLNLINVDRSIKSVDVQPFLDGGVIVNVIGKVQAANEPLKLYAQTFVFKPQKGSFFLQHDIFRVIRDEWRASIARPALIYWSQ